jgi:signal transduction histidine kinase/DNA-binding NarL/FixJ family response regulator
MLIPGTQMHIATFIFVCIEIVIFFYLVIYRLARPDDKKAHLNIVLISLLIVYNVTGGLLPDPNLPGSYILQTSIAYGTGFITPCYFPYYVLHAFGLEKMKFHAYRGVYLFLILPYLLFVCVLAVTGDLQIAKNLLILPVLYALWVVYSLIRAIRYKYGNKLKSAESKEELSVLFLSIASWVGLPIIDYFNLGQAAEASMTNVGFLLLLGLQVKRHIRDTRKEQQKLIESEMRLLNWNTSLQNEVEKRTRELEKLNDQRITTFVNLAHETKTPLTLINNYLEEYLSKNENTGELSIVKRSIDKLSADISNLFDLEKFNKGVTIYNHELIADFSEVLGDSLVLFQKYADKKNIEITAEIESNILIKADPLSVNRIVNNLLENAIKFSFEGGRIDVSLKAEDGTIQLSVKDYGIGIHPNMHKKVFEPYFQISNSKRNIQGMGLGMPIMKKVIDDLKGEIEIFSNPSLDTGTEIRVRLPKHQLAEKEIVSPNVIDNPSINIDKLTKIEIVHDPSKQTILLVEDNITMINYLQMKLQPNYNVHAALNGNEGIKKLKELSVLPDLIITDVMMDKVDGYSFAKIISNDTKFEHIPFIFLSAKSTKRDKLLGLKLGAIDFIQKPFSVSELLQKIESILQSVSKQKKAILSTVHAAINVAESQSRVTVSSFEKNCHHFHLTPRETDIARLICQGIKYKEIGETLFIAERTVTKHAQNIFEKVGVSSKIELINKLEGLTT